MSKLTIQKKKTWSVMSRYIRQKYADKDGFVKCCSCSTTKHWKEMQAGHFVPAGRGNACRFIAENVHPQCFHCNINLGGNASAYALFMLEKYGETWIRELEETANTTVKFTVEDLKKLELHYKELTDNLLND